MITVTEETNYSTLEKTYTVKVPYRDLIETKLDAFDRAVLNAPMENAADVLQNLQILAFRQSQQQIKEAAPHA